MTYLVTGATGGFGHYALHYLKEVAPNEEIFALARSEEKSAALRAAGVNVRLGDYADIDSMKQALEGIDRLLFVSGAPGNRQAEHANVVEAAKETGVSYIAYTSFADADHSTSILAPDHQFTEKLIKQSGIKHTFLRNNWYIENELPIIEQAMKTGEFVYAAADGKTGWALKREYAEAAANVLVSVDVPEILELSGNLVTYEELAEALEKATGKKLEIIAADNKGFVENLKAAGFPQEAAEMFLVIQHDIKKEQLAIPSKDLEKVLGKPLVSLDEALKELLNIK
ncbi:MULTISPECIES: SDR family oxidoreductase [unclassified Enterococcus]|uniref:SDR family oxidoreductase n=1 Tax=unclassified Enterococcus TaxID=2608891 RepID=UPI0013EAAF52|nr:MULTISPECIES: SDR family oxidoreductase [unclassified Enterococcus]